MIALLYQTKIFILQPIVWSGGQAFDTAGSISYFTILKVVTNYE